MTLNYSENGLPTTEHLLRLHAADLIELGKDGTKFMDKTGDLYTLDSNYQLVKILFPNEEDNIEY